MGVYHLKGWKNMNNYKKKYNELLNGFNRYSRLDGQGQSMAKSIKLHSINVEDFEKALEVIDTDDFYLWIVDTIEMLEYDHDIKLFISGRMGGWLVLDNQCLHDIYIYNDYSDLIEDMDNEEIEDLHQMIVEDHDTMAQFEHAHHYLLKAFNEFINSIEIEEVEEVYTQKVKRIKNKEEK